MIDNFRELAEGAREVRLQVNMGDLKVRVGPDVEPRLTWDSHGDEPPEVSREGDTLRIKQVDSFFGRDMDVDLQIRAAEVLVVKTGKGEVDLAGAVGTVRIDTGNGDLTIADVQGELHASTGNGEVELRNAEGHLRVNSGNGELQLKRVAGTIDANTGRGEIGIELVGPTQLRANTGMGEIQVRGASLRDARLNSGKGDLECESTLEPGRHVFNTGFGDISVLLPADAKARVDLQTGFGDVISDFALVRVGRSGPMGFGGARMVGSIGEGDPEIEVAVKTGKGDLTLRSTGGPAPGAGRARVSVGFKDRESRHERHRWRGLGVDLASTISAEVASAIASSLGGRGREENEAPRVQVHVESTTPASAPTPPSAPVPPSEPAPPSAPPPPPVDLSGAVRSAQTPVGPEVGSTRGEDPTLTVLQAVARGEITPEEAEVLLAAGRHGGGGGPV